MPDQFADAPILSNNSPGSSEFGHIGNRLSSQTLEVFVWTLEDVDHCLQSTQLCYGLADLNVAGDLLQDLQSSDLHQSNSSN